MKPQALLDINVLLALVWAGHVHHARVVAWHREWMPKKWVLCPLSEAGFLRLSLNRAFVSGQATISILRETLRRLHAQRSCIRIHEVPDPSDPRFDPVWKKVRDHQQVMDAMLLSIAIAANMRLATLDEKMGGLADRDDRIICIP